MPNSGLRIAVFTDSYFPILNGVSVSVHALITGLRDRGHSVHLFTAAAPNYKDDDPNIHRFRSLETPFAKGYPLAIPPFYRTLLTFRKYKFDLIHTHTPFTIGFVGMRWAESHELPLVSTYHTLYDRYSHYVRYLPRRYVRFRIAKHTNFYYNKVAEILTPSETAKKWLERHSVMRPITVVPTGVPRGPLINRAEARLELGIPPEQRILLYVGRLAREKNLDTLFEAAAHLFRSDRSLRLWLVGDGPFREECRTMARSFGIGDRVRFVGFVPRDEVNRYYAAADLFVFPSMTETQGLVVLEAMNYGLPAIAVGGGGASENVESGINGFVVKNDPDEFAQACTQTLEDDSLYSRLSEGALRTARAQGPDQMVESVLGVYDRVLKRNRTWELPRV